MAVRLRAESIWRRLEPSPIRIVKSAFAFETNQYRKRLIHLKTCANYETAANEKGREKKGSWKKE